jgi:hypothetical protein
MVDARPKIETTTPPIKRGLPPILATHAGIDINKGRPIGPAKIYLELCSTTSTYIE